MDIYYYIMILFKFILQIFHNDLLFFHAKTLHITFIEVL